MHAGIDAEGLDPNLDCHHLIVNDWQDLEASQNVCIISIPSVFDASLAPAGKHTIHAYVAANEPYDIWQGLDKKSEEYRNLKVLWTVTAYETSSSSAKSFQHSYSASTGHSFDDTITACVGMFMHTISMQLCMHVHLMSASACIGAFLSQHVSFSCKSDVA